MTREVFGVPQVHGAGQTGSWLCTQAWSVAAEALLRGRQILIAGVHSRARGGTWLAEFLVVDVLPSAAPPPRGGCGLVLHLTPPVVVGETVDVSPANGAPITVLPEE